MLAVLAGDRVDSKLGERLDQDALEVVRVLAEILTVVALVYFVLIWPGSWLSARLERRLAARD